MAGQVSHYRLIWDPIAKCGGATIYLQNSIPICLDARDANEFNAIAFMLKEPGVVWNGYALATDFGSPQKTVEDFEIGLFRLQQNPNARKIIEICEDEWPANKSDCSGFVKDVATALGVSLSGQANDIVEQISGPGWINLADGKAAKKAADEGRFVIAGLKGSDHETPSAHGHVVVVVSGPIVKEQYPTAYWGTLGGTGERAKTINWAWKSVDRDKVKYACR
jgi:hypothetical protein